MNNGDYGTGHYQVYCKFGVIEVVFDSGPLSGQMIRLAPLQYGAGAYVAEIVAAPTGTATEEG